MSDPIKESYLSVEQYLLQEQQSTIKHEYVRGSMYAMTGASGAHNLINGNLYRLLGNFLADKSCSAYVSDMKLRVEAENCFYYPDTMVSCEPVGSDVLKSPIVIAEVLSPSTKQIDRREKKIAYRTIATLNYYLIVHQDRQLIELHSRVGTSDWEIRFLRAGEILKLSFGRVGRLDIALADIYKKVEFPSRVEEDEAEYEFLHHH